MHIAVTIGLLGFLGSGVMAMLETVKAHGGPLAHPDAVESQAAGRPVLGIDGGGLQETVIQGTTGVLVASRSAPALAGNVRRLSERNAFYKNVSGEGAGNSTRGACAPQR